MTAIAGYEVGLDQPLLLLAGPDTLESLDMVLEVAGHLKEVTARLGISYVFKGSFDKANRSSHKSYRGPGMDEGLHMLSEVQRQIGVPVITDVHEDTPIEEVAAVADVIQTPAFLCRQTNFMQRVALAGKPVNVKKGQFMSPWEMGNVVAKMREVAPETPVMLCERGFSFGYNNLVSDMRGLAAMRATGCPVVFDCTHSVQLPGGQGNASGGQREYIPVLARAAIGAGVSGLFMETHPKPDEALCDGPNSWPLALAEALLTQLAALHQAVQAAPLAEDLL
ncbi:2-dehydro-3-deoxyphosphooctonate aldolase [Oceanococcus atlanticus]|uniref:2-dehydro-3-deoxyphosphooctonate aldolase n=1 Tax=Oceanococcus atlanticus TaxID=1317117 RepID=A0A1Y1SDG5_9GAMM|nr:3-deoxy-8-phosphooctulonate synthase [Oceanococcus atlanticus]ORE87020.1 2-dehydro-3-deoxyphosphooctonate aldolase [Oceanococcus atlanticus]